MENNRYRHTPKTAGSLTAIQFDGTDQSIEAIRKAFPDLTVRVKTDSKGDNMLEVRLMLTEPWDMVFKQYYLAKVDRPIYESFGYEKTGGFSDHYFVAHEDFFEGNHTPIGEDPALLDLPAEGAPGRPVRGTEIPRYVPYPGRPNSPAGPGSPIMLVTDERGYFQLVFGDREIPMNTAIRFSVEETVDRVTEVTATFAVEMGRRNPDLDKSDKNV